MIVRVVPRNDGGVYVYTIARLVGYKVLWWWLRVTRGTTVVKITVKVIQTKCVPTTTSLIQRSVRYYTGKLMN